MYVKTWAIQLVGEKPLLRPDGSVWLFASQTLARTMNTNLASGKKRGKVVRVEIVPA